MNDFQNGNPFNTGSPARGEGFFGRKEIIDDILLFLKKSNESTFLVFGQRRIGKTSLLRKLQDDKKLVAPACPVYFNLQDKARTPLPQLLFEIAQRVVLDLDLKIDVFEADFTKPKGPDFFRKQFIPAVCAELGGSKPLLLLFDEFDVLGDIEDVEEDTALDVFAFRSFIPFVVSLTETIQQKKHPVKFVFAVGRNYKDLDTKRYGQLTKFVKQKEISYFSKKQVKELLEKFSSLPFEEEAIVEIYDLTSGHPFFIQCLGSRAFDNAEKIGKKSISREIVREEFIPTIESHSSGVKWVWDSLSAHDQIILYLMAILKEENKPLSVNSIREKAFSLNFAPVVEDLPQIIERLKTFKFIKESDAGYDFYVEFMRQWIVKEIKEAEIAKNLPEIDEEIEFHLSNARYYFRHGNYKNAAEHFETVLKKSPYHFEALLYLARSYKSLIQKDIQYLEKALTAYQKVYQINADKSAKEYLYLLSEHREYLEERDLYKKYEPEGLTEVFKRIIDLKSRLGEMENLKEKCDILASKRTSKVIKKIMYLGILVPYLLIMLNYLLNKSINQSLMISVALWLAVVSTVSYSILSGKMRAKRLNIEQKKQYFLRGFDIAEYKRLKKELEEAEKLFAIKV